MDESDMVEELGRVAESLAVRSAASVKVGDRFNADGITWEVVKAGGTQSKVRAVTKSERGRTETYDNKIITKNKTAADPYVLLVDKRKMAMDNERLAQELLNVARDVEGSDRDVSVLAGDDSPAFDRNARKAYFEVGKLLGSISGTSKQTRKQLADAVKSGDSDDMMVSLYDVLDELDFMENELVKIRGRIRGLQAYIDREEAKRQ